MNFEKNRLETFNGSEYHDRIAEFAGIFGFYLHNDCLICHYCNVKITTINTENLNKAHKIYSPYCALIRGNPTDNIPCYQDRFIICRARLYNNNLPRFGEDLEKPPIDGIEFDKLVESNIKIFNAAIDGFIAIPNKESWIDLYMRYSIERDEAGRVTNVYNAELDAWRKNKIRYTQEVREGTLHSFPKIYRHMNKEMAAAGLMFNYNGSALQCFCCHVVIDDWGLNDDPWIRHFKLARNCPYIRCERGDNFIIKSSKKIFGVTVDFSEGSPIDVYHKPLEDPLEIEVPIVKKVTEEEEKARRLCTYCLENDSNMMFLLCHHVKFCDKCHNKDLICPVCQKHSPSQRIYF